MSLRESTHAKPARIRLPAVPVVAVTGRDCVYLSPEGEISTLSFDRAGALLRGQPVMVCHAPYTRAKLGGCAFRAFDVLELFAFVHPGAFCVPTPQGLARGLGLDAPGSAEDRAAAILSAAEALLGDLRNDPWRAKADPLPIAGAMGLNGKGWAWTPFVFSALGETYDPAVMIMPRASLNVWKNLPEWAEEAPAPPPSHFGVSADESRARLARLVRNGGKDAEPRPEQIEYATRIAAAFDPPDDPERPAVVLAEAGTGTGKTLGYLAPASVWAEKNGGTVWISTYTRNLQRQIDQELDRLYPDAAIKAVHSAVRKGRENYLCLLNLEESAAAVPTTQHMELAVAAGIMARWAAATRDGDLTGPDFPGWLPGLLGVKYTSALSDRRGECVYSACDHYHRCFVEHSVRKSKRARIVVANHALVMIQSALSAPGEDMPTRYIFDEGHHLFEAADSAFAAHLSAVEARDLRRWIRGAEGGRASRARGLKRRAEDLAAGDAEAEKALLNILHCAACLPADNWTRRLKDGEPAGEAEKFLHSLHRQTLARCDDRDSAYSLETSAHPATEDVLTAGAALKAALEKLRAPMRDLITIFRRKLAEDQGMMEADTRKRLDAVASALERRSEMMLRAWIDMLEALARGETAADFVDWVGIEREQGRAVDVGLYRHHVDPTKPFARSIAPHLHGMAVTSATLRDGTGEAESTWDKAFERTGARWLAPDPEAFSLNSPFDYAARTKIFIVNDVRKDDIAQVAGAYRALFAASGGGALGLFTAIQRLRGVHERIAAPLEDLGIPLYAQHVDEIDSGTLVDMFREDLNACLLGTDAVRDGVDVPGESLRLIVFDRVPWPRPTLLHKARRERFGGKVYDEALTRLKLKQAFGRLIRTQNDRGAFVMMDSMMPSRLHDAFPPGVEIRKAGLAEVIAALRGFF